MRKIILLLTFLSYGVTAVGQYQIQVRPSAIKKTTVVEDIKSKKLGDESIYIVTISLEYRAVNFCEGYINTARVAPNSLHIKFDDRGKKLNLLRGKKSLVVYYKNRIWFSLGERDYDIVVLSNQTKISEEAENTQLIRPTKKPINQSVATNNNDLKLEIEVLKQKLRQQQHVVDKQTKQIATLRVENQKLKCQKGQVLEQQSRLKSRLEQYQEELKAVKRISEQLHRRLNQDKTVLQKKEAIIQRLKQENNTNNRQAISQLKGENIKLCTKMKQLERQLATAKAKEQEQLKKSKH